MNWLESDERRVYIPNEVSTLAIFGLAKNTGKTTTLNAVIESLDEPSMALTSIGLDGEAYDQLNHLPKPRIKLKKNHIIATAKETLTLLSCAYERLEETNIPTALGPIMIVRLHEDAEVLIAGPTTNQDLARLLSKLKKYAKRLLIDGALNRKTFTQLKHIDGLILATGAAAGRDFNDTLALSEATVRLFTPNPSLYEVPSEALLSVLEPTLTHYQAKDVTTLKHVLESSPPPTCLLIKGAVTDHHLKTIMKHAQQGFTLLAEDPSKWLFDHRNLRYFDHLNVCLGVLNAVRLLAVTINPWHPSNQHYCPKQFKEALQARIDVPVINVLERRLSHEA